MENAQSPQGQCLDFGDDGDGGNALSNVKPVEMEDRGDVVA